MKLMGWLFAARSSQLWLATQKLEAVDGNVHATTLPEDAIGSYYGTLSWGIHSVTKHGGPLWRPSLVLPIAHG
jgi:hypothetical protein